MATDRRRERQRAVATTATGLGLAAGGAVLRDQGIDVAHANMGRKKRVFLPGRALLMRGSSGPGIGAARTKYAAGAAIGLSGAAAATKGVYDLSMKGRKRKAAPPPIQIGKAYNPVVLEGLRGTKEALREKKKADKNAPTGAKAIGLGAAIGGGLGSSGAMHGVLDAANRRGKLKGIGTGRARAVTTALTGVAGATAVMPLAAKGVERQYPGYRVTAAGVQRDKRKIVPASRKASQVNARDRGSRRSIVPSDSFGKAAPRTSRAMINVGMGARNLGIKRLEEGLAMPVMFSRGSAARYTRDGRIVGRHAKPSKFAVARDTMLAGHPMSKPRALAESAAMAYGGTKLANQGIKLRQAKGVKDRFGKAAALDYRMSDGRKRAAITAAGGTPLIGPIAGPLTARRLSNPEDRNKSAGQQYAGQVGAKYVAMAGGAYGAAYAAKKNPRLGQALERKDKQLTDLKRRVTPERVTRMEEGAKTKIKSMLPAGAGDGKAGRVIRAAAKPLAANRGAAAIGGLTAGAVGAFAGGQMAINQQIKRDRNYTQRQRVGKAAPELSQREKVKLARKKRLNASLSLAGGAAGITGLGLMAAKRPGKALWASTAGGGIGGVNALVNTPIQRKEAQALAPTKKQVQLSKAVTLTGMARPAGVARAKSYASSSVRRSSRGKLYRVAAGVR